VLTGNTATIKLRNKSGNVLVVKTGTVRPHPSSVANNYTYPIRQLITVDGVPEVIEQRGARSVELRQRRTVADPWYLWRP